VLLREGREEIEVTPAVTAVLLHHSAIHTGTDCILFLQGSGELSVMSEVTAVLLLHIAMDTGTDFIVVTLGWMEIFGYACCSCSTFTSQCYG